MPGTLERALEAGLRIRPGEQRRVVLMSLYAANAIGAVVVGRSIRDALYLANRPARGLAGMYIWSSLAIVLVSWLYARIADRVPRGLLNAACALGCAALAAAFWAMFTVTDAVWVYAGLYVFVEVMGSLVVIQFWTLASDVFHAREAKRLFGLIGAGGTLANVIFGLLVGRYAPVVGAQNLLLLPAAQLALCAVLAQASSRTAATLPRVVRSRPVRKARVLSRAGLAFLANKHLTIVALIGAISAAAVTIVDFQFKLSAAAVLDQDALAGYFGRFYGVCGAVALAVQLWLTGRVLERYGILASLLPLPLGLAAGSATAGWMSNPGLFVSSLAKGSDTIFRYTLNDASMQLLYVPVQAHVRGRAKAFIDGILKPTSVALAGAALLFYKESGGRGGPLAVAVLLLAALWVVLLVRARAEYVHSLVESLERRRLDLSAARFSGVNAATLAALRTALAGDTATVLHALTLVEQLAREADFTPELRELLQHEDASVRAAAVGQLGALGKSEALPQMRRLLLDPVPGVRAATLSAICAIEGERAVPRSCVTPASRECSPRPGRCKSCSLPETRATARLRPRHWGTSASAASSGPCSRSCAIPSLRFAGGPSRPPASCAPPSWCRRWSSSSSAARQRSKRRPPWRDSVQASSRSWRRSSSTKPPGRIAAAGSRWCCSAWERTRRPPLSPAR